MQNEVESPYKEPPKNRYIENSLNRISFIKPTTETCVII